VSSQSVPGSVPTVVPSVSTLISCMFPVFPVCVGRAYIHAHAAGEFWKATGNWEQWEQRKGQKNAE
jgi:hypothetical protein